jgi:predicted RND superfamily exporter protein
MQGGGDANVTISSLGISIDMGWVYGLFILYAILPVLISFPTLLTMLEALTQH